MTLHESRHKLRVAPCMPSMLLVILLSGAWFLAQPANAQTQMPVQEAHFAPPPLGWNSWNSFSNTVDAKVVTQQAKAMVSSGMKAAGYEYVVIDEGWWLGKRDPNGNIIVDKTQWPALEPGEQAGDMANIARFIHGLGLKAGIYTDAGEYGCGYLGPDIGPPIPHTGSLGHYERDFLQFAKWGFDYVKVDWCGGDKPNLDPAIQYAEIARALIDAEAATGHHLFYSICNWGNQSPWTWAPGIGGVTSDMWRTGGDITAPIVGSMHPDRSVGVQNIYINFNAGMHPEAQHTGYYNDLDMMVIGMRGTSDSIDRMHMSLWAVAGAPLIVGSDLAKLTRSQIAVLTNPEVLAVDQDPLGLQATKVAEPRQGLQVWSKVLAIPGKRAVVLLNKTSSAAPITVTLDQLGLSDSAPARVRNLWSHQDLDSIRSSFSMTVPPNEAAMVVISGTEPDFKSYTPVALSGEQTRKMAGRFAKASFSKGADKRYVRFEHVRAERRSSRLRIVYSNGDVSPVVANLQVNGETPTRVLLPPTGGERKTEYVSVAVTLQMGEENTIAFWNLDGSTLSSVGVGDL